MKFLVLKISDRFPVWCSRKMLRKNNFLGSHVIFKHIPAFIFDKRSFRLFRFRNHNYALTPFFIGS